MLSANTYIFTNVFFKKIIPFLFIYTYNWLVKTYTQLYLLVTVTFFFSDGIYIFNVSVFFYQLYQKKYVDRLG